MRHWKDRITRLRLSSIRKLPRKILKRIRSGASRALPASPKESPASPTSSTYTGYTPEIGLLPWFNPLNVHLAADREELPSLNVILPSLSMRHLTGGPNTAIILAGRLAALGIPVRLVSADAPVDSDSSAFWNHVRGLLGVEHLPPGLELVDASNRQAPFFIGVNDLFMATAWWTAQMVKYAVRHTRHDRFIYLIQDYEPLLHPASTEQALAEETYGLDHIPVVNTRLLHEFLSSQRVGRFSDLEFAARAIVFEPAIDTTMFFPEKRTEHAGRRRLLFYTRPTIGRRNLFEMGVAALKKLIAEDRVDPGDWKFIGIGEQFQPVSLGRGAQLEPAPWLDFPAYAGLIRSSDVLLSLMLSPHPSYPPLEMAACNRPVVTSVFGNKTAERLAKISSNIIGVKPTIEGIAEGLIEAMQRRFTLAVGERAGIGFPATWAESLSSTVPRVFEEVIEILGAPRLAANARIAKLPLAAEFFPGYRHWPTDRYNLLRPVQLRERENIYKNPDPSSISFLTTVWNTDPKFVEELAESVFGQDAGQGFEWIILDNGTTREDTRHVLASLARHPSVRLLRVDENIGIIRGIAYCLQRAKNRYIVPLDSDDLLTPDCIRVLTSALKTADYPALAYSDEDKVLGDHFLEPYYKPDWDPVLFAHSCYIAHICTIDRELALRLGAYSDPDAVGSHDWDTFTRFHLAGYVPLHIPEVLYTWRKHPASAAANINSKNYIHSSQQTVLKRLVAGTHHSNEYLIESSPLFDGTPDWRIIRPLDAPLPITTILIGGTSNAGLERSHFIGHRIVGVADPNDLEELLERAKACAAEGRFVHLHSSTTQIEDPSWASEGITLMELFPDTVIVGGRIHHKGTIIEADAYFGFGDGCDSPNRGRSLKDPGYFAQMWKPHSASAVSVRHCLVRADFLAEALGQLAGTGATYDYLGAWLGAAARERGRRVVYSPFFCGRTDEDQPAASAVEKTAFIATYQALIPDAQLLSPRLGLTPVTAYQPLTRSERQTQELAARRVPALPYGDALEAEIMARIMTNPAPDRPCRISLLTSVYERTSADVFRETVRSALGQSLPFTDWVIHEDGVVPRDVSQMLDQLASTGRVRHLRFEHKRGIIGGLRACLEHATGDYVIPLDHDDLLTRDALQQVARAAASPSRPALIFSDEDVLTDSGLTSPFRRLGYDPILNTADSYIWHICAFRRQRALEFGVYSDSGAEFCQDWDTVCRFIGAGASITHIPLVLYHWRSHHASASQSGTLNEGSLASVKHVMQGIISRQQRPDLYDIALFPISRGVDQYAIRRRPIDPLPLGLVTLTEIDAESSQPSVLSATQSPVIRDSWVVSERRKPSAVSRFAKVMAGVPFEHVLVLAEGYYLQDTGLWEAMRLFEMHSDVALVGGRIIDQADRVMDCCASVDVVDGTTSAWVGKLRTDPGIYAMALKPQSVVTVPEGFFFCRTAILRDALAAMLAQEKPLGSLSKEVVALVKSRGLRIAYSPLIEAVERMSANDSPVSSHVDARIHVGSS